MLTLKQDTMLGDIPGDWDVKPLNALLKSNAPGDWGDDGGPHMVRVLRSTNLTNDGRLDISDIALRALKLDKAGRLPPARCDILLERSGGGPDQPVGRVGFVESDMPEHAFSNFLHLLRPDEDAIDPRFLAWVLCRINRTGRVLRLEQQTTQMRNLNFRDYADAAALPVPLPDEQAAIARVLDAVDMAIERTRRAIERGEGTQARDRSRFLLFCLGDRLMRIDHLRSCRMDGQLLPTEACTHRRTEERVVTEGIRQPPGVPTFSIAAIRMVGLTCKYRKPEIRERVRPRSQTSFVSTRATFSSCAAMPIQTL